MPIELRAHGSGNESFIILTASEDEPIQVVVERFRGVAGYEAVAVSIEDDDEDLGLEVLVGKRLRHRHHVHFHRCHSIEVSVSYAGRRPIERPFRANYRLQRVFDWAVGPEGFNFNAIDAGELVLAYGDPVKLANNDLHVGDLPAEGCRIELALVPKSFFQGCRS